MFVDWEDSIFLGSIQDESIQDSIQDQFNPELIYTFNGIPMKILPDISSRKWQVDSKIHMEIQIT